MSNYKKTVIDWVSVQREVNMRLNKSYSANYIQNVWRGVQKSDPILTVVTELIGKAGDVHE